MEESTNTPAKKKNTGLIAGIIIAVVAVIIGVVVAIIVCSQPKTLEDYYKKDAEFAKQVNEAKESYSTDGLTTDITFSGNTMKISFKLSGTAAENADAIAQMFEAKKSDIEAELKPYLQSAEQDGVKNAAITLEVTANNTTVWSDTVK